MQTIAETIYPVYYKQFEQLAEALEKNDTQLSQKLKTEIMNSLNTLNHSTQKMQALFFYEAFTQRFDSDTSKISGNLYLLNDNGQQIKQFNFMAEKFPIVTHAQELANSLFIDMLGQHNSFTFIDIGIGSAQQVVRLIRQLKMNGKPLSKITVIGIEPSLESLEKAQSAIDTISNEFDLSIEFIRMNTTLEQLTEQEWKILKNHAGSNTDPLFINASFALHHIQPLEVRETILKNIKQLEPKLFLIIEPYSDHTLPSLVSRFKNAWHHYGLTFKAIDSIEAPDEDKEAAKRIFFGREILDVIRENNRIEQFETAEMWLKKLKNSGFLVHSSIQQFGTLSFNDVINRRCIDHYIGMNVGDFPIVSIIAVH